MTPARDLYPGTVVAIAFFRMEHFMSRLIIAMLVPALFASLVHAAAQIDPACDVPDSQTVLQAVPAAQPLHAAEAVWLDHRTLRWPGAGSGGIFKLYHHPAGAVIAVAGATVSGAAAAISMMPVEAALSPAITARFKFVGDGVTLALPADLQARAGVAELLKQQLVLVEENAAGVVLRATRLQIAGALDSLYAAAAADDLGVIVLPRQATFKLWAPTASRVGVCIYPDGKRAAQGFLDLAANPESGTWSARIDGDLHGRYYAYLVDVHVPGVGMVRNRVTDPYSVSLTTNSTRSYVGNLEDARLKPAGWDSHPFPKLASPVDLTIYELHVRDFSINDLSVPARDRGKYLAFVHPTGNGMKHLAALARAGMTDVHLLPVFDLATVPESGCVTPSPKGGADSESQQAAVVAVKEQDCYNWGYDPFHYTAPEGSFASDAADGAVRIREFRRMVQALHRAGLRVGMDVVYNHTAASGQNSKSVLDRIVPGYYQRLDAAGKVEMSTCCDNTATENMMMEKLMSDSVLTWARHYRIDSFRFDLMGHQPRAAMERLHAALHKLTGREIQLIGEGWNFGEIADGRRFVQASQLSLNGSGIGTFSDRARDAVRGGGPADSGVDLFRRQGYINGLVYDRNAHAPAATPAEELLRIADMVRVGLAGSLRSFPLQTFRGGVSLLSAIDYNGQPAGYVAEPSEVVNYVENHDNQTLYDSNVFKLPVTTTTAERARVQILGAATTAFSQGIAYFHAGIDILRSKSLDRNSYDSGDWFNRLDWRYRENYFGTGLPPKQDNGKDYELLRPLLANPALRPSPEDIAWTRDAFRDLLRIRASSTLFRLRSAADIRQRLSFANTGPNQVPTVIAARLDGSGYAGANFREVIYLINVDLVPRQVTIAAAAGKALVLHPVHRGANAADKRPITAARFDAATGMFDVPPRTAVVYVLP